MKEKVLRVGVINGKKVVEERRLKSRIPVSVGGNSKNTFVAACRGMPERWPLFDLKEGGYELVFSESMSGYVHIGDEKVRLRDLVERGEASKHDGRFRLSLDAKTGGRVQVADDVSILFHFVDPHIAEEKSPLPAAMKIGFFSTLESSFTGVLAASFVLHAIFSLVVSVNERSLKEPSREDVLSYIAAVQPAKITIKKPKVVEPPSEPKPEAGRVDEKEVVKKKSVKAQPKRASKTRASVMSDEERRAQRDKTLQKAVAILIGTESNDGAFVDILRADSPIDHDITNALEASEGVRVPTGRELTREDVDPNNTPLSLQPQDFSGPRSNRNLADSTKKKTKRPSGSAQVGKLIPLDGRVDKRGVSKALRRRGTSFQACYESALKSNSELKGKLVVEFTIDQRGKASSASVVKDGLGSSSVSRCVMGVVKRIRFPKPDERSVTITNSFVFTPNL